MINSLETSSENMRRCFCVAMPNILSLYKFSRFVDLKSYFVCSDFVLLWTIRIAC